MGYYRVDETRKRKLNPKCVLTKKSLALSNEGIVLPCCECDTKLQWEKYTTKLFIKLTELSNIEDFDSIEEVISQPVWKEFQDELLEDRGPEWCYQVCGVNENDKREHLYSTYEDKGPRLGTAGRIHFEWHKE